MYRIGIIDDIKNERADIQVSVLDNVGWNAEIEFKEYGLEAKTCEDIIAEIGQDIDAGNIHTLIVDFNLDTITDVIEGWKIMKLVHEEAPEFPVVIITNVPDESKKSLYIDADKVYTKKVFLQPELDATKQCVRNIMLNMEKYVFHRKELETRLEIELKKLDENGTSEDTLEEVIRLENELSKYKRLYQTRVNKTVDMSDLRDAFENLEKYERAGTNPWTN